MKPCEVRFSSTVAEVKSVSSWKKTGFEIEPYEKYTPDEQLPVDTVTLTHDQLDVIVRNVCTELVERSLAVEDADVFARCRHAVRERQETQSSTGCEADGIGRTRAAEWRVHP